VALLELLSQLKVEYDLTLVPAHLNHGFRGEEAEADAAFCRDAAAGYGLELVLEAVDMPALIKEKGLSAQSAARQVRYDFFFRTAKVHGANKIALGHHGDDQAETLLMRLLRGAGSTGLAGIPFSRDPGIIRPLMEVRREEILCYLRQRGIEYREDASNRKGIYLRNRIRSELLPLLAERYNPSIVDDLCTTAEILRDEDRYLEKLARDHFVPIRLERGLALDSSALARLHPALVRRILRMAIAEAGGRALEISFKHVAAVMDLMAKPGSSAGVDMPRGLKVRKVYERLEFYRNEEETPCVEVQYLPPSGRVEIPALGIRVFCDVCLPKEVVHPLKPDTAILDFDKCVQPLGVRSRLPGDTFRPAGFGRTKKLKRFFIDQKVPCRIRDRVPIFVNGDNEILWVGGYRMDSRFAADGQSSSILMMQFQPLEGVEP
jgi:tRNA(Ile)-lysidine synthase